MSTRSNIKFAILTGALSATVASTASAELLQLTYSFRSTARLNGIFYENQPTTLTVVVDTDNRTSYSGNAGLTGYRIVHNSTHFTFGIYGSGEITTGLATVSGTRDFMGSPTTFRVGLGLAADPTRHWYDFATLNAPSWDMLGTVGPTAAPDVVGDFIKPVLNTTIGTLQFNAGYSLYDTTFTATVIPAPGAIALLGLAGLAGRRRR